MYQAQASAGNCLSAAQPVKSCKWQVANDACLQCNASAWQRPRQACQWWRRTATPRAEGDLKQQAPAGCLDSQTGQVTGTTAGEDPLRSAKQGRSLQAGDIGIIGLRAAHKCLTYWQLLPGTLVTRL
jgi:hypothetical protein